MQALQPRTVRIHGPPGMTLLIPAGLTTAVGAALPTAYLICFFKLHG